MYYLLSLIKTKLLSKNKYNYIIMYNSVHIIIFMYNYLHTPARARACDNACYSLVSEFCIKPFSTIN